MLELVYRLDSALSRSAAVPRQAKRGGGIGPPAGEAGKHPTTKLI